MGDAQISDRQRDEQARASIAHSGHEQATLTAGVVLVVVGIIGLGFALGYIIGRL